MWGKFNGEKTYPTLFLDNMLAFSDKKPYI
jgi:hypothetical protein